MSRGLDSILGTMASALSAESIRMNTTASNLANAGSIGGSEEETYHTKHPLFAEITQRIAGLSQADQPTGGVQVTDIIQSQKPLSWRYEPDNPIADSEGHVYVTDVNPIEEMTNMITASKQYQAEVEVMNSTKNLLTQVIHAMNN